MKIIHDPEPLYRDTKVVYTEHKGSKIAWRTAVFSPDSFSDDKQTFDLINRYWAYQSEEIQDEVFKLYTEIDEIFNSVDFYSNSDANSVLSERVVKLMNLHPIEKVKTWVQTMSDVRWPTQDLAVEYVQGTLQNDKNHSREKTYILDDYVNLSCMILQLRIMVPIWGKYIDRTAKIFGTVFKEYYAFSLLQKAKFMDEPGVKKLYLYIKSILPEKGSLDELLVNGVSSEEYPIVVMATHLVRKLSVADIRGLDPTPVIIRHISRYVMEKAARAKNSIEVLGKNDSTHDSAADEDQISKLELYKIREEISRGDVEYIRFFVSDVYRLARSIEPSLTDEEINEALMAEPAILDQTPNNSQTQLLMWLIDPVIASEGVQFLSAIQRARCLCAMSAAYWKRGHIAVSALCTASVIKNDDGFITSIETKSRIDESLLTQLQEIFPFAKRPKETKNSKHIPEYIEAIDELVKSFSKNSWQLNLSEKQMSVIYPRRPQYRRYDVPHDCREQFARLIIDIQQIKHANVL